MNRKEFVRRIAEGLRNANARKPVTFPKRTFFISDEDGNEKSFTVPGSSRGILYTVEDVENITNMAIAVIEDALKNGDNVSIVGFGRLGLKYYKARSEHARFASGGVIESDGFYTPKFDAGKRLKLCGKIYEMSQKEGDVSKYELPAYDVFVSETDEIAKDFFAGFDEEVGDE